MTRTRNCALRSRRCGPKLRPSQMVAALLMFFVRVYQLTLSKILYYVLGPVCRFEPSCSHYALACLRDHGALRGSLLSVKRLCRCHPLHPGGYDPPPPPRNRNPVASPSSDTSAAGSNDGAPGGFSAPSAPSP